MWPKITLANGVTLEIQQRIAVKSLIEIIKPFEHYGVVSKRKPLTIRKGDKVEVRHWPPGRLTMVKPSNGSMNFNDAKEDVVEGIDFEVISGAEPYPKPTR